MIQYLFELLRDKPEQEQLLLRLLVNKLVPYPLNLIDIRVMDPRKLRQRHHISYYNWKQLIRK
jgi:hypothetical protein